MNRKLQVVPFRGIRIGIEQDELLHFGGQPLLFLGNQLRSHGLARYLAEAKYSRTNQQAVFVFPSPTIRCRSLTMRSVPEADLEGLRHAAQEYEMNRGAGAPALRLPDPDMDPGMYRVNGLFGKRRLMVLWGVEGRKGSSLPAEEAIEKLEKYGDPSSAVRPLVSALATIAVFLLAALFLSELGTRGGTEATESASTEASAGGAGAALLVSAGEEVDLYVEPVAGIAPLTVTIEASHAGLLRIGHGKETLRLAEASSRISHTFERAGSYPVVWTPDEEGRIRGEKIVTVLVARDPLEDPGPQDLVACLEVEPARRAWVGEPVTVTAVCSFGPPRGGHEGLDLRLDWDAQNSEDAEPDQQLEGPRLTAVHQYTQPGSYEIRLQVTDPDGRDESASAFIEILDLEFLAGSGDAGPSAGSTEALRPVALLAVSVEEGTNRVTAALDGKPGADGSRVKLARLDWGDPGTEPRASRELPLRYEHRYTVPGEYWITGRCWDAQERVSETASWRVEFDGETASVHYVFGPIIDGAKFIAMLDPKIRSSGMEIQGPPQDIARHETGAKDLAHGDGLAADAGGRRAAGGGREASGVAPEGGGAAGEPVSDAAPQDRAGGDNALAAQADAEQGDAEGPGSAAGDDRSAADDAPGSARAAEEEESAGGPGSGEAGEESAAGQEAAEGHAGEEAAKPSEDAPVPVEPDVPLPTPPGSEPAGGTPHPQPEVKLDIRKATELGEEKSDEHGRITVYLELYDMRTGDLLRADDWDIRVNHDRTRNVDSEVLPDGRFRLTAPKGVYTIGGLFGSQTATSRVKVRIETTSSVSVEPSAG